MNRTLKHRILLTGYTGQVGTELVHHLPSDYELFLAKDKNGEPLDLRHFDKLRALIHEVRPTIIINPAAYTAVDKAESEQEEAHLVNAVVPEVLATEAKKLDALLVHYSTDYVFNGNPNHGPWKETDTPDPLNVYGATKLAGERAIQEIWPKHLIFRTSWVYSNHGRNFLKTMLKLGQEREELKVVCDQIGAPTSAAFLAENTYLALAQTLKDQSKCGLYHLVCGGSTTWHGFTEEIFQQARPMGIAIKTRNVLPIPSRDYPTPAKRPENSVMETEKYERTFSIRLIEWKPCLDETLRKLNAQSR